MIDFPALERIDAPFRHWAGADFVRSSAVDEINAAWPAQDDPRWRVEGGRWARKASILFPQRVPAPAHALASLLYSDRSCRALSELVGRELLPDPWFLEAPPGTPLLGGGLHEIRPGGLLRVHVDFERHPSGLRRVANLLIYLNQDWNAQWGGALELHGPGFIESYPPRGGFAVLFLTTPDSWHGHPAPLTCPSDRARRSLALYFYARDAGDGERISTVYRSKD
jgi:hypothetical protein